MFKRRCCVLTFVKNESVFLPIWLRYYTQFFSSRDIYAIDHQSDDGSIESCRKNFGFTVIPVKHDRYDAAWRVETAKDFQRELLRDYEYVLYCDADEIVIPDPRKYADLRSYLDVADCPYAYVTGYNLFHSKQREKPLDLDRPILSQRRYAYRDYRYDKPLLSRIPLEWVVGFHWARNTQRLRDRDLWMIHLHKMDFDLCWQKHSRLAAGPWSAEALRAGHSRQFRITRHEDFVRYFESNGASPRKPAKAGAWMICARRNFARFWKRRRRNRRRRFKRSFNFVRQYFFPVLIRLPAAIENVIASPLGVGLPACEPPALCRFTDLVLHWVRRIEFRWLSITKFNRLIRHFFTGEFERVGNLAPRVAGYLWVYFTESERRISAFRESVRDLSPALRSRGRQDSCPASVEVPYRRLKILYVCGLLPSECHGGGQRLLDLLTRLSLRHDLDLYAMRRPFDDLACLNRLREVIGNLSLTGACPVDVRLLRRWLHDIDRDGNYYDIVQLEYPYARHLAQAVRPFGRRVGYTFMECDTLRRAIDVERSFDDPYRCGPNLLKFIETARGEFDVARDADFTIAVTPEDRDFVIKFGGCTPSVIPTCVPDEFFDASPDAGIEATPSSAAFVGCFDHEPNVEAMTWYFDEIHPRVLSKCPGYRLDVIGSGRLEPVIKMTGGAPSVRIVGFAKDLPRTLRKVRIGISPLISGAGIRGKVNQYAAAGRPVVATGISLRGLPYANGDSVVRADTPDAFASGIIRLLTDEAFYRRLQQNAYRAACDYFRWDPTVEKLEKIYLSLKLPDQQKHGCGVQECSKMLGH